MDVFEMPLELRTLRGEIVTRLTDGEFFQLCQDNPSFNIERSAQHDRLTAEQRRKFPPVCPEFVLEVKSPSDRLKDLHAKMGEYLANGVQLGFLLDVDAETAYVYRPGQAAPETVQGYDRELSGEPVLPGLQLDLRPLRRTK